MFPAASIRKPSYLSQVLLQQQSRSTFSSAERFICGQRPPLWALESGHDLDWPAFLRNSSSGHPQGSSVLGGHRLSPSPDGLGSVESLSSSSHSGEEDGMDRSVATALLDDDRFFGQYSLKNEGKTNKSEGFPIKLYRIIYEAAKNGDDDIISFSPSGLTVMIHKPDEFVAKIMPKYFTSQRMSSFQRQLNLYGFRRRRRGPDRGGFFHDDFVKNHRNRCFNIERKIQSFKIPPHLLDEDDTRSSTKQSRYEAPASPSSAARAERSPVSKPALKSLPFTGESSPPRRSVLASLEELDSFRSLHGKYAFAAPSVSDILEVHSLISAAKKRAAMKQQLVWSAFQEAMHYV